MQTLVINLKRRPDRKTYIENLFEKHAINDYKFFEAVDGKETEISDEISELFFNNDFDNKKGFIGVALSHYRIWQNIVNNNITFSLIFEDDVKLVDDFKQRFDSLIPYLMTKDLTVLGMFMNKNDREKHRDIYENTNENIICTLNYGIYIGGSFAYTITLNGAKKLLKYIKENGIKHGIDFLFRKDIKIIETNEVKPSLAFSDAYSVLIGQTADSDIQNNYETLDIKIPDNYKFYPNLDQIGNDIYHKTFNNPWNCFKEADSNPNVKCFNTLGYFKNKVDVNSLTTSQYFGNKDGTYVKIINNDEYKMQTLVINLKRRPDRKTYIENLFEKHAINDYKFFEAVDGKTLCVDYKASQSTQSEINNLFYNNDFGNRIGVIGIALSHYRIWQNIVNNNISFSLIFEDDVKLVENFSSKFEKLKATLEKKDFTLLGGMMFKHNRDKYKEIYGNDFDDNDIVQKENIITPFFNEIYIGGAFSYTITLEGAKKMVNYISEHGIKHGIDYLFKINKNIEINECKPQLAFSDFYDGNNSVNTDIQNEYTSLTISIPDHFRFYPNLDQMENDIYRKTFNNPWHYFVEADSNPEIKCFNTLGFFKNNVNTLTRSQYFGNNDGTYVKVPKVKFMCNWTDSKSLTKSLKMMYDKNSHFFSIYVEDINGEKGPDFYIVINSTQEFYEPSKTIVFQGEPWCYQDYQKWGAKTWGEWANPDETKFKKVITTRNGGMNLVQWQYNLTPSFLSNYSFFNDLKKDKIISTICSSKSNDPGHVKRLNFLKFLEEKDFEIDIYGFSNDHNFKNYLKPLSNDDKQNGYLPYKYYFIAENNNEKNYITEKLWEPILAECLCFYWGSNPEDYINEKAYVKLNLEDFENDFKIIQTAIKEDWQQSRLPYIREAKEKIIKELSLMSKVNSLIV